MINYDITILQQGSKITFAGISKSELEKEKTKLRLNHPRAKITIQPEQITTFDKHYGIGVI